jgi:hypothetical protein
MKDSIRIAFYELGEIHYKYGMLTEAIKAWVKSHDFSSQASDLLNVSYMISVASYEVGNN